MRMKAGLSACSDGQLKEWETQNIELQKVLAEMGIDTMLAEHVYAKTDAYSGSDEERANDLMQFYKDDHIDVIYDITGGDLANGVLQYLNWDVIAQSGKIFWGYCDLTTIINAIYVKTGKESVLYQVKNLVYSDGENQRKQFSDYVSGKNQTLFAIQHKFLQGEHMEGIVVGGNLRCLLKLAGTEYWPDMTGKILLLEAYGGKTGVIATALNQLEMLGVFEQVSGVLLGTFSKYENADLSLSVYDLLKMHISDDLPVAYTRDIGHNHNAKAIKIGAKMHLF